MRFLRLIDSLAHPLIRDEAELRSYVVKVSVSCALVALGVDIVNHVIFFVGWAEALRSWSITVLLSVSLAFAVSRAIARSHLKLHRLKDGFETLSRIDPLTGLLNRRALLESVGRSVPAALALVIADIDSFKRVNDTFGHLVGDRVIREVAAILVDELGDLGRVGRLGGEEFALIAELAEEGLLRLRLEQARLRIGLARVGVPEGEAARVTISIGLAIADAAVDFDRLYASADQALYAAKAAGGDRIVTAAASVAPAARNAADARAG
jgi:diguanylate cyclase (GGDEF)-like protein